MDDADQSPGAQHPKRFAEQADGFFDMPNIEPHDLALGFIGSAASVRRFVRGRTTPAAI